MLLSLEWICMEWNECWKSNSFPQPVGAQHVYVICGLILSSYCLRFGCGRLSMAAKVLKERRYFSAVGAVPFCKAESAISIKKGLCWLLFLAWNFKHVRAGCTLLTLVHTIYFTGWNSETFFFLHVGQNTPPITSWALLSTPKLNISFVLSLVYWIETIMSICLAIVRFIFCGQSKSVLDSNLLSLRAPVT